MKNSSIKSIQALQLPWATQDPFIFCSYHYDDYPGGKDNLGPNSSLEGRNIGQDFGGKDGWNMYHGSTVPGFPSHPHSGFETVSIVTKGMVDHSDSLGGKGRFGGGDVQWLTSGKGVQHAEMFPLLDKIRNPFEIFQLWLNLPQKNKKVDPYYKMIWSDEIPVIVENDKNGNKTNVKLIAGCYKDKVAALPNPDSWAANTDNKIQIWIIKMEPHAVFKIQSEKSLVTRSLYFYEGKSISIADNKIEEKHFMELDSKEDLQIINGDTVAHLFYLQGKPIGEPVVQYGPFVSNSKSDLQETIQAYQKTQFGGWPWNRNDPTHGKNKGRFAKFSNGKEVIK